MTKDMTVGNPLRLILSFSIPLIFGNIFQQLYNMADSIIVGRVIGLNALTAVGASSAIIFLIVGFTIGTCSGLGIPIALQFGAKDYKRMRMFVYNSAYLAVVLAIIITAVTSFLCDDLLRMMKTPQEIFDDAYKYMLVICLGIPFTFLYNTCSAIIRALGDSRTPFYFLLLSTIVNIVLDLFFILVLHTGVEGAALATILAQGLSGVICFWYMKKRYEILQGTLEERAPDKICLRTLLFNSVPMGLQSSVTAIGSIMLQSAVNMLDAVYVSAYAAVMKVNQLSMCPYEAVATACATMGGQNLGAGKIDRIKKGLYSGIGICFIYSILIGIVLVTSGSVIAWLFIDRNETAVLGAVQQYFGYAGFFFWLLAILNCTRMTIQGLGYSGIAIFAGCAELLARAVMSLFVIPVFGYTAVCFTNPLAWLAAVLVVVPVFFGIIRKYERQVKVRD